MPKSFHLKEPEKQINEKQITKEVKEKQEIKEKHEKNEAKDTSDTKVHKDQKDTKDTKEQKEHKEQKEQKEQKEKQEKESKNEHKEKTEKEKHEKEAKEVKEHHKEHLPKESIKEALLEKLPEFQQQPVQFDPESVASPNKSVASETAPKFIDHKPHKDKFEKAEIHEKIFKNEKFEHKELEKFLEVPFDPGGPVESRLAALEANVAQLMHFIPADLRPDLSQGALKQEPETSTEPAAEPAEKQPAESANKEDKKK